MLLSKPQKELLGLLRQFGTVREDQMKQLLRQHYSNLHFDTIVHQMLCGGLIRRENGYLFEQSGVLNPAMESAVDVMLLLEPEHIEMMQKGTDPFALTFFKERQEKLWRYDICIADPGREAILCAALENINHKYRMIVFVLQSLEQQKELIIPCEHCFALKENGKYRFYK